MKYIFVLTMNNLCCIDARLLSLWRNIWSSVQKYLSWNKSYVYRSTTLNSPRMLTRTFFISSLHVKCLWLCSSMDDTMTSEDASISVKQLCQQLLPSLVSLHTWVFIMISSLNYINLKNFFDYTTAPALSVESIHWGKNKHRLWMLQL